MLGKEVTVGSTPTLVQDRVGSTDQPVTVTIRNPATGADVWIGGPTVATSGGNVGFKLSATESVVVTLVQDQVYAICGTSQVLSVLVN